jgi:hypothetical protein
MKAGLEAMKTTARAGQENMEIVINYIWTEHEASIKIGCRLFSHPLTNGHSISMRIQCED